MYAVRIVILAEIRQLSLQVTGIPEERLVKKFPTNGSDDSLDEEMQAKYIELSPHNFQSRQHRLIQQIYRLLESLILHECCIGLLSSLYRSMAQKMLYVCDCSVPAQQTSGKCLSQLVR